MEFIVTQRERERLRFIYDDSRRYEQYTERQDMILSKENERESCLEGALKWLDDQIVFSDGKLKLINI